jgi:hypothetical protein
VDHVSRVAERREGLRATEAPGENERGRDGRSRQHTHDPLAPQKQVHQETIAAAQIP